MAKFNYRGRDKLGATIRGQLEAANEEDAANGLLQRSIIPLELKEAKGAVNIELSALFGGNRVSRDELHILTRQLYSLVRSGIPVLRAIMGLAEMAHSQRMKDALHDISEKLTSGRPLSTSMNQHKDIFDSLFISMVHVGENSGKLDEAFKQLSSYIEQEKETRKRVRVAMNYPIFVLVTIVIAIVVLNIFVIPKFAVMFSRFGTDLPLPTQILMATSEVFVNYWPMMLTLTGVTVFGIRYWMRSSAGKKKWDRWKLKMPAVGSIIERSALSRYCRSFAMMLKAGVPMTQALSLVADSVDNAYMHDRIVDMRRGLESGESILRVSNQSKLFTPLVLQMVAVGEETGQIDRLLDEAADIYEDEVDYDLKNLTAKLEPILIGIVAGVVLILAMGIYLPMWELLSVMKNGG
ncbi:MAG: type II secretion system F family protein [Shewanella sp.]|nr:type II secretion system F family protein [Shewanella sp.]MCF1429494.1 type II secretion system F family protein [Shewanella sp.]MCF1439101.1 type II secretion system F family protein [Shewanella sp.]MCF1457677.1 type II secretion system F family protein [Shewanella sp.]